MRPEKPWWDSPWRPGEMLSVRIWNEARGLDWGALPTLIDLHGITDVELLIAELIAIREFMDDLNG